MGLRRMYLYQSRHKRRLSDMSTGTAKTFQALNAAHSSKTPFTHFVAMRSVHATVKLTTTIMIEKEIGAAVSKKIAHNMGFALSHLKKKVSGTQNACEKGSL